MMTLVVGASDATGQLLVQQLLNRGQNVKVIVRSPDNLPEVVRNHDNLSMNPTATVILTSGFRLARSASSGCFV